MENKGYNFAYCDTPGGYRLVWDVIDEYFEPADDVNFEDAQRYAISGTIIPVLAQQMFDSMEEDSITYKLEIGYFKLPDKKYTVKMTEREVINWLMEKDIENSQYLDGQYLLEQALQDGEVSLI